MRTAATRKRRKRTVQDPPPAPTTQKKAADKNGLAAHLPPQHSLGNFSLAGRTQTAQAGENHGTAISLEGLTRYEFADADYEMPHSALSQGSDCEGCEGRDCVTINAPVNITYRVTTTVTLPSASDYPDLSDCERANVQNAIDTVLAPHEQEHVDAVAPYNGTETVTFSGTHCRSEIPDLVDEMVEAREATRQAAARARSDALDPFNFTIDPSEGCEETPEEEEAPEEAPEEGKAPEEGEAPEEAPPEQAPEEAPPEQAPEEAPPAPTPEPPSEAPAP